MNKPLLIQQILATLAAELATCTRSARSAHADATDEQNKAENKYDTRGLEASYLARGQAQQAADVMAAIQRYEGFGARDYKPGEPIDLCAAIELESNGERTLYFLGPHAGGAEIIQEGLPIFVITPTSPLGRQLVGKRQGEKLQLKLGPIPETFHITRVW